MATTRPAMAVAFGIPFTIALCVSGALSACSGTSETASTSPLPASSAPAGGPAGANPTGPGRTRADLPTPAPAPPDDSASRTGAEAVAAAAIEPSTLAGTWKRPTVSTSSTKGGRTTCRGHTGEMVLDVDDLLDLPRGRPVVFSSGNPATLIATEPWHAGPHAEAVAASIADYDPASQAARSPVACAPAGEHNVRTTALLRDQLPRTAAHSTEQESPER